MLYECADDDCGRKCRIDRKGAGTPTKCVDDGHTVRVKRVTDLPKPIIQRVFEVPTYSKNEIPSGWTLFHCIEYTESVYITEFIDYDLSKDDWDRLMETWKHDRNLTVVRWTSISNIF